VVARDSIELPTRGFSVRARRSWGLNNQPLAELASPHPGLTQAQSRHTQSEFGTFSAQSWHSSNADLSLYLPPQP
jgi:hypothetical protein